jgi:hypothetical protein
MPGPARICRCDGPSSAKQPRHNSTPHRSFRNHPISPRFRSHTSPCPPTVASASTRPHSCPHRRRRAVTRAEQRRRAARSGVLYQPRCPSGARKCQHGASSPARVQPRDFCRPGLCKRRSQRCGDPSTAFRPCKSQPHPHHARLIRPDSP